MARSEIPFLVQELDGDAVAGASISISVRGGGNPAATVYSAETGSGTLSQPLTSTASGRIPGWLEEGSYQMTVSGTTISTYTRAIDIVRGDAVFGESRLAANSVSQSKIQDNAISTAKIQDDAVTAAELADNAVTSAHISANAVTTVKIPDNAITAPKIADGAISTSKIPDTAITSAKILDSAVTSAKLATDAVTQAKLADNSVGANEIIADSVGSSELANDSVTAAEIASNAVGTTEIADGAVTPAKRSAANVVRDSSTTTEISRSDGTAYNGLWCEITTTGRPVLILFHAYYRNLTGGIQQPQITLRRDASALQPVAQFGMVASGNNARVAVSIIDIPSAGFHWYDPIHAAGGDGTGSSFYTAAYLSVVEL